MSVRQETNFSSTINITSGHAKTTTHLQNNHFDLTEQPKNIIYVQFPRTKHPVDDDACLTINVPEIFKEIPIPYKGFIQRRTRANAPSQWKREHVKLSADFMLAQLPNADKHPGY